jgi:hypothetical protein
MHQLIFHHQGTKDTKFYKDNYLVMFVSLWSY